MKKLVALAFLYLVLGTKALAATTLGFQWDRGGLSTPTGTAVSANDYILGFGTFSVIPTAGDSFATVQSSFTEIVSDTANDILFNGIAGFYQTTFMNLPSGAHDGQQIYLFARNTAGTEYGVFTTGEIFPDPGASVPFNDATFTGRPSVLQTIIGGDQTGPELFEGLGPSYQLAAAAPANDFASWISGFGLDPSDQDFEDDPDRDRLSNGLEAWFGTDPGKFNAGLAQVSSDGTTTTFTHPANPVPVTNVDGFYQWSPDLVQWFANGGGPAGGPIVTISSTTTSDTVTVSATASEAIESLYLRVGASQN